MNTELRWNSAQVTISRTSYLMPALLNVDSKHVFPQSSGDAASRAAKRGAFKDAVTLLWDSQDFVDGFLPLLVRAAQWTQFLSARDMPTVSFVLSAIVDLKNRYLPPIHHRILPCCRFCVINGNGNR